MNIAMIKFNKAFCQFDHGKGTIVTPICHVDLEISDGEFVCLLGRSGHGKSTLVRALAGLQALTDGSITVRGEEVMGPGRDRGMVFQEDTVFPWLTVRQNVEFGMRAQGVPAKERWQTARQWIEEVGLAGFENSWPNQMSGGMRKRVAIANVFANGSPILLMDEPFGPLDYITRRELQGLIAKLWEETGRTIIFITHDVEEALILAQRILVVQSGRISEDIKVDLPYPRDEVVRAFPEAVQISRRIFASLELSEGSLFKAGRGEDA